MSAATAIRKVEQPFKIFVGNADAPKVIHAGNIGPGKTTIKNGESIIELGFTGGDESFPNYWEAYARRTINGKHEIDGVPVDITNPKYTGELEFLDSKQPGGMIVHCRYVKGVNSLDYLYQVNRLNIISKEKDEQNLMIILSRGEHEIDPAKDAMYALAIKVHPMNTNSKNRTERYKNSMYKEVSLMDTNVKEVKEIQSEYQAMKIVNESATSFAKLKVLHTVLSAEKEIPYNKSDENELFSTLVRYAKQSPEEVLRLVRKYKEDTTSVIEKTKSFNAFDTATNGTLKVGLIKKEVILDGLDVKGEAMIQYLFDNCLEPKNYDAINTLHQLSQTNFK